MVIPLWQLQWIQVISKIVLVILIFVALRGCWMSVPPRKQRWPLYRLNQVFHRQSLAPVVLQALRIPTDEALLEEMHQQLIGCGIMLDAIIYYVIKRMVSILFTLVGLLGYLALSWASISYYLNPTYLVAIAIIAWIFILLDKKILAALRKQRRQRIVKEVYALSSQLLYYEGSSMNLHSRLVRCIPHTKSIRNEMYMLTNEWYQDTELALQRFKERMGTEEGYSFAETINSLRLHENNRYYDLLRQRIGDYKEKMELNKESKQETTSYVLFILAGIPILNTFRVFIYPWVAEGQKLFDTLN